MEEKNNYNSIDLFKFIFSICVIAIHTHPLESIDNKLILNLYDAIVQLSVPFFFISTGFLIGRNNIASGKECNDTSLIKKSLIKTTNLYIFWSIIYLPLAILEYIKSGRSIVYDALLYVRDFLFVGQHYNSWMLWYLLSCIYSLIFIYVLSKKTN